MSDASERDLPQILAEFAQILSEQHTPEDVLTRLGNYVTELLPVHGIGVLIIDPDSSELIVGTANTDEGMVVEKLEADLGEGPCTDAIDQARQISVPDLGAVVDRYPSFAPQAIEAGIRSVHGLPMAVRTEVIGAVDIVCTEPRDLSTEQLSIAQLLADVAVAYLVNSKTLREKSELADQLQHALDSRVVVEQAKGRLAERHSISSEDAFERIRGHARSTRTKVRDVAQRLIDGDLEL